jgi:hypothetical protein
MRGLTLAVLVRWVRTLFRRRGVTPTPEPFWTPDWPGYDGHGSVERDLRPDELEPAHTDAPRQHTRQRRGAYR